MSPDRLSLRGALIGAAALTLAGGGALTAVTAQAAAAGCQVTYTVANRWGDGFTAAVAVRNLGDPVNGWRLTWSYAAGQRITASWNATHAQDGARVTVSNAAHTAAIGTGSAVEFGFNASWNGTANPTPTGFALNGVACTGAVTATSAAPSPPTGPPPTAASPSPAQPPPAQPPPAQPPPAQPPPAQPPPAQPPSGARQVENLGRGVVSVRSGSGNLVSWRLLGTESFATGFHVYRDGVRVTAAPVLNSTNFVDANVGASASYTVRAVLGGVEQPASARSVGLPSGFLDVRLQVPDAGSTPGGERYTYAANDASVGDLDGDGQYEIVLKWNPSNAKDNSQAGYTGNVFVDAYRLDGTRLWRIDLGRNIRAGAHYTQFQVYDYDGDGRAEVAMKTADGTVDGTGRVLGNGDADHRNGQGRVLAGPEWLTMFHGLTGAAASTVPYDPPRGSVTSWGDGTGNRVDRFLAGTAYLDGQRPSLIMARGYYTRTVIAAWDFRNGALSKRWTFDSDAAGNGTFAGQGNHNLSIADVDADGRDEVVYGSATVDDNGRGLYSTRLGHGDALHVGDLIPGRPGLEVFTIHEAGNQPSADIHDARTGAVIRQWPGNNGVEGPGRGVAADIDPGTPGAEFWGAGTNMTSLYTATGTAGRTPSSANFLTWWDGDTTRELLDRTMINKYGRGGDSRLLTAPGVTSINGTKATPALSADLLGDWREEVIWPTANSTHLRIFSTPHPTGTRLYTLMHDTQYRTAVAWQNTGYNQPPHPGYHIGDGMAAPSQPRVYVR